MKIKLTHTRARARHCLSSSAYSSSFCHRLIDLSACCHQSSNNEKKKTEVNSSNLRHIPYEKAHPEIIATHAVISINLNMKSTFWIPISSLCYYVQTENESVREMKDEMVMRDPITNTHIQTTHKYIPIHAICCFSFLFLFRLNLIKSVVFVNLIVFDYHQLFGFVNILTDKRQHI